MNEETTAQRPEARGARLCPPRTSCSGSEHTGRTRIFPRLRFMRASLRPEGRAPETRRSRRSGRESRIRRCEETGDADEAIQQNTAEIGKAQRERWLVGRVCPQRAAAPFERPTGALRTDALGQSLRRFVVKPSERPARPSPSPREARTGRGPGRGVLHSSLPSRRGAAPPLPNPLLRSERRRGSQRSQCELRELSRRSLPAENRLPVDHRHSLILGPLLK